MSFCSYLNTQQFETEIQNPPSDAPPTHIFLFSRSKNPTRNADWSLHNVFCFSTTNTGTETATIYHHFREQSCAMYSLQWPWTIPKGVYDGWSQTYPNWKHGLSLWCRQHLYMLSPLFAHFSLTFSLVTCHDLAHEWSTLISYFNVIMSLKLKIQDLSTRTIKHIYHIALHCSSASHAHTHTHAHPDRNTGKQNPQAQSLT